MPDLPEETSSASASPIILASASPRRSVLLKEAGPIFASMRIMTADVKEGDDPLENAMRKAEAVAKLNPQALVIGADTVIRFEDITHVTFSTLTPEIIDKYVRDVNVLDKAGAYAIQEHGEDIIESIDGSLTNVIGLPVERLKETFEYLLKLA